MTLNNFKDRIYGFINRQASLFTVGATDHVLCAINDARRVAQRDYAFELLRSDVFISTSAAGANWMTGCTTAPGGTTAVQMRRLDSVWQYTTGTVGATTIYPRTQRIVLDSPADFKRELPIYSGTIDNATASAMTTTTRVFAYCNGATLYVNNIGTATSYMLNGIKWLDDLNAGDSPDIFLTFFADWLLWGTLMQLNQFLKADERVGVDMTFVNRLWKSVQEMDGQIANAGDSATLD